MSPTAPFLAPERDTAFKKGRPKAGGTALYTIPGIASTLPNTTGGIVNVDIDHYGMCFIETPVVVDQLACEVVVTASGKLIRFGLYAADTDWQPIGAPLADSGDVSTTVSGVKTYTPAAALLLPRGRYLTVINNNDATFNVGMRTAKVGLEGGGWSSTLGANCLLHITASRAYAAFPTPGATWTAAYGGAGGMESMVYLRVSAP